MNFIIIGEMMAVRWPCLQSLHLNFNLLLPRPRIGQLCDHSYWQQSRALSMITICWSTWTWLAAWCISIGGILCLWCVSIDGQDAVEDAIKRIWSDCIDRRPEDGRRWFIASQNANPCVHLSPRGPSCQSTISFFCISFGLDLCFTWVGGVTVEYWRIYPLVDSRPEILPPTLHLAAVSISQSVSFSTSIVNNGNTQKC